MFPTGAVFCSVCGFDKRTGTRSHRPTPTVLSPTGGLKVWHFALVGGVAAFVVLIVVVAQAVQHATRRAFTASQTALANLQSNATFAPIYPDRGQGQPMEGNATVFSLTITGTGPALPMHVRLYLPAGTHAPGSLPCVFIAPAGTRMVHGSALGDGDSPEHLPYVRAGFAVLAYELSGDVVERPGGVRYIDMAQPIREFLAADGGLLNARAAIEFVLDKAPEINPTQLYTAGHSSAATMALNVAAADHRIRACVAYAPGCDVVGRLAPGMTELEAVAPGTRELAARVSPMLHVNQIDCPVYLFHADDDTVVSLKDNQRFADAMRAAGKQIDFVRVPSGNHYESMIRDGIPGGIRWLIAQGATAANPVGPPGFPAPPTITLPRLTPPGVVFPHFTPPTPPPAPPFGNDGVPPAPGAPPAVNYRGYTLQVPPGFKARGVHAWVAQRPGVADAQISLNIRTRTDRTSAVPYVMTELGKSPPGVHGVTSMIGGTKDLVTIGGLQFVRVRRHAPAGPAGAFSILFTAYDDTQWLTLTGSCADADSETCAVLEGIAESLHHVPQ